MKRKPSIVAHKGASAYRPGNTQAAFELAVEQGADCIELDVQLTADGHILVYDRWCLDDGTNRLSVAKSTLEQIRQFCTAQQMTSTGEAAPGILTLPQALALLEPKSVEVMVELKNSYLLQPPELGHRVAEELKRADMLDRSYVFSFDHAMIAGMRGTPGVRTGILYVANLLNLEDYLQDTGCHFIETRNDFVDEALVQQVHARGVKICGWSTVDPVEIARLCTLGVDMVKTDAPDVAVPIADTVRQ
ncbi:glycerophosphodiester phosphodiesterase [Streptomyces europaeiscabiei]|uniref:Glycerophosphodiester phosphodiesterase n=1 Tax=Streptomyces europaeiscabiei TaxID=146819 RepID=A0ABU4NVA3_9ACTN|nr:glycerophosphodiester phosphodiesterase [Streptomyces europaeiscabiei]MDX3549664.1 glycerophosphodiester phosphodiesterase [Streptomyces europaeiscabiei]MDX3557967.1 glycerophosphodiester phosphodiesterase [Streptomyces europaeiscabiei]MDX3706953.1 glycerophosphodiester phosphodiesterase [Streptomyces europaeiscabiei]